jgi:myo-inositol 2-dehydrogenase/D-chiro-inositol 1-dehydrogenase
MWSQFRERGGMIMTSIRVGFVGAGGNAKGHMERLSSIDGVQIVAVADVDQSRAEEAAAKYNARAYTDHHPMLDREELDVLYVSVPPFAHSDAEIVAAQAGIHLFVEKPVVLDIDLGRQILAAIDAAGVVSCVGYQLRLLDSTRRARDFLVGKTVAMVASRRWGGLPGTPWWRKMAQSGGQLVEQTTHQVDLMRYIMQDEIVEVYACYELRTMVDVEGLDIPDTQAALFKFASGAVGTISTSPMLNKGSGRGEMEFLLRDQILCWEVNRNRLEPPGEDEEVTAEPQPTPNIDQAFVAAVLARDPALSPCTYRDGLQTCVATLACNQSAENNEPVTVPLV